VLAGASNLKYSARHFSDTNFTFVDVSTPGWTANPLNIARLAAVVENRVKEGAKAFVFDLLGNSSVRYEQFDGTTSLPYKSEGKFHFAGDIVVSPDKIYQKTVESIVPILTARQSVPCVIIPPLPRYLFAKCCSDTSHCTNWNSDGFPAETLSGFIGLRQLVIKTLTRLHVKNFRVSDACCMTNCTPTANTATRIAELRKVTSKDGIHFVESGYKNLASSCVSSLKALLTCGSSQKSARRGNEIFYWRGFRSPVGGSLSGLPSGAFTVSNSYSRPPHGRVSASGGRGRFPPAGRPYGYHPYKR
jgi:hypothetical protein